MDSTLIQKRVDELSNAMVAKGMSRPRAELDFGSHEEPNAYLAWTVIGEYGSEARKSEFIYGDDLPDIFRKASAFISEQPSAEEAKMNAFMKALGGVIDLGNRNGIEVDFLNPLVETMKRLSENALTDGRARTGDA